MSGDGNTFCPACGARLDHDRCPRCKRYSDVACASCEETLSDVEERGRDVCLCFTDAADMVDDINRALADYYFDREAEARHERYEAEAGR